MKLFCTALLLSLAFAITAYADTELRAIDLDAHILSMTRTAERQNSNWRIAVLDANDNVIAGISRPGSTWNILSEIIPATAENFTMLREANFTVIVTAQTEAGEFIDGYATAREVVDFIGGRQIVSGNFRLVTDVEAFLAIQNGFVYFGRPTCPACGPFSRTLYDLALSTGTTVYYFNTDMLVGHPQRAAALDRFGVTTVPSLFHINNGQHQRVNVSGEDWVANFHSIVGTEARPGLRFAIGSTTFMNNGVPGTLEAAPFIADNRTMVPLRVVATAMGATNLDMRDGVVSFDLAGQNHALPIGTALPEDMGTPVIVQNRTFVPLIYVINVLGVDFYWDAANRAAYIFID